jgi:hypothetical protein
MSRSEDAGRIADDLESLRTGTLLESEFRAKYQAAAAPSLLNVIWPTLDHYLADVDIRERDPDYRDMQDGEMEKLIRLLRAGAPDTELAEIHFLGES